MSTIERFFTFTVKHVLIQFLCFCADTTYQVTFKTGDRPNAGTTAKVQFELFGDNGKTEAIQLSEDRSLRLFDRGNSDKFKVDTRDVGKVCREVLTGRCHAIFGNSVTHKQIETTKINNGLKP